MIRISFIVCLLACLACESTPPVRHYTNPLLDAFRKHGVTCWAELDGDDTIRVSRLSNLENGYTLEIREIGAVIKMTFDSLGFMTQRLLSEDVTPENIKLAYSLNEKDQMVQTWIKLESLNFPFLPGDSGTVYRTVIFDFDELGRIAKVLDTSDESYTIKMYDTNGKEIEEQIFTKKGGTLNRSTIIYNNKNEIQEIRRFNNDSTMSHYEFDNGIPKFFVSDGIRYNIVICGRR